ncbi:hypothetical protein ACHAXS_008378 [Conticribra weissflogii]
MQVIKTLVPYLVELSLYIISAHQSILRSFFISSHKSYTQTVEGRYEFRFLTIPLVIMDYPKAFVAPACISNRTRPRSSHVINYNLDPEHILATPDFHLTTFSPGAATIISSAQQFSNNLFAEIHSSPTFWEPIYLSSLAGASTCLGASVAFLVPMIHKWRNDRKKHIINETDRGTAAECNNDEDSAIVGPDLLSFSLALAGSVMITVCLVSIIPECLDVGDREAATLLKSVNDILRERFMGFGAGVGVYAFLSKVLNKLPEESEWGAMLGDAFLVTTGDHGKLKSSPEWEPKIGSEAIFYQQLNYTSKSAMQPHDNQSSIQSIPSSSIIGTTTSPSLTITDTGKHPIDHHPDLSLNYPQQKQSSWRLTLLLFLSLLLHNFPEGVAVSLSAASANGVQPQALTSTIPSQRTKENENPFGIASPASFSSINDMAEIFDTSTDSDSAPLDINLRITRQTNIDFSSSQSARPPSSLASLVTISIALHNIPEGIAICIPCLKSRPDQPWLAFGLASLSGLAEPIGAFVALIVIKLREEADASVILLNGGGVSQDMRNALAFVAGIMLAVAVFELIPEADRQRKECDTSDSFVWGVVIGVGVMMTTELFLA